MPIYEFECTACGARREELMRLSDPDPTECPACHAPKLRRLMSAPSFRLSGSGWYETDFKKDGKRNLAGDGGEAAKPVEAAATKSDSKADSKPEQKTGSNADAKAPAKSDSKPEKPTAPAPAKTVPKPSTPAQ